MVNYKREQSRQLIFSWPSRHATHVNLLTMLGLAALLHVLGFYLFKAITPFSRSSPPVSATVSLLDSQNPSLNVWLEAEDPTLFTQTASPKKATLPNIPYIPSYDSTPPTLAIPQTSAPISIPCGPTTAPVKLHSPPLQIPTLSPREIQGTQLILGGGLSERHIQTLPPKGLLSSPSTANSLPCVIFIAVSPEGQPHHLFLLHSSGNFELDRSAMQNLQQLRFNPISTARDTWGTITYSWGMPSETIPSLP